MKFIIRSGKVRGEGARYPGTHTIRSWNTRAEAEAHGNIQSAFREWRIVRLLSPAEAKRKFAAGVLREMTRGRSGLSSGELRRKADELWPARKR